MNLIHDYRDSNNNLNLKYFKPHEFLMGEPGQEVEVFKHIAQSVLISLDKLRALCDFPININSSYRTPEYNATLPNSAKNSYHVKGLALDITGRGRKLTKQEKTKIIYYAGMLGFTGIGVYNNFIHLDRRPGGAVFWDKTTK
jgi:uncharacterized protein YcbK (DUF882 family)